MGGTGIVEDFGGFYKDPAKEKAGPNIVFRDVNNDGELIYFKAVIFSQQGHHPIIHIHLQNIGR